MSVVLDLARSVQPDERTDDVRIELGPGGEPQAADRPAEARLCWQSMDHVTFLNRPKLEQPPLICAFKGWNDGGEAASIALRYLRERWDAETFATVDPEEFYDFQVTRPTVRLEEGVSRVIEWPKAEFAAASVGGRDVALFGATEPNVRWRTFTGAVLATAKEIRSSMLVTLGAFLTDVPSRSWARRWTRRPPAGSAWPGRSMRVPPASSECSMTHPIEPACRPSACGRPSPITCLWPRTRRRPWRWSIGSPSSSGYR